MRRVVVWVDQSSDGVVTARWAAQYAEACRVPLHLVQFGGIRDAVPGRDAYWSGPGGRDVAAEVARALMYAVRRVSVRHPGLAVSTQIVGDGRIRPGLDLFGCGDVLVTGPAGYIELAEHAPAGDVRQGVGVPLVVVPAGTSVMTGSVRQVLLLVGERFSEQTAVFAFETAVGLRARVNVVSVTAQCAANGVERGTGAPGAALRSRHEVEAAVGGVGESYREVAWSVGVLGFAPWRTFRSVTRGAYLTVLSEPTGLNEHVRRLLCLAESPLAFVPAQAHVRVGGGVHHGSIL
jgi:hypothetical protein